MHTKGCSDAEENLSNEGVEYITEIILFSIWFTDE
jgi:hypothetical protein